MESRWDKVMSMTLTLAAMVIAISLARRTFFPQAPQVAPARPANPTTVANWGEVLAHGTRMGPTSTPVTIVEFADLECPFCRMFYQDVYQSIDKRFPGQVALVHVDFPITGHRFARPAARAATCAKDLGIFKPFIERVYERQDSLGLKSWVQYGIDAGVKDTAAFNRCATSTAAMPFFDSAAAFGRRIGVRGTPTVMINGWRFPAAPDESTLSVAIRRILSGSDPFPEVRTAK
jgi:protein-disulfide isomerase